MSREHEAYLEYQREAEHEAERQDALLVDDMALAIRNASAAYRGLPPLSDEDDFDDLDYFRVLARAALSVTRQPT